MKEKVEVIEELWALQDAEQNTFDLYHGTMLGALKRARALMREKQQPIFIARA